MKLGQVDALAHSQRFFMSSYDAWYLLMFAFGLIVAWAVIKGLSE